MSRREVLRCCILALLARGLRYGSEIVKTLDTVGQLLFSQRSVCPFVNRLPDAIFVSSRWEVSNSGRSGPI